MTIALATVYPSAGAHHVSTIDHLVATFGHFMSTVDHHAATGGHHLATPHSLTWFPISDLFWC
jgi:hypothetical protein